MKRAFSGLSNQLLRRVESDELQSTLRFLARGSKPAISSLINRSQNNGNGSENTEEEAKHVERILKILNSTLPEVEPRKRHIEAHYDVLFSQLKKIVETSIEATDRESSSGQREGQVHVDDSGNVSQNLYDKLMLLRYTNQLTSVGQMAKILLSKDFKDWDKVWDNISLFSKSQRRNLSLLLYFRSWNPEIWESYEEAWLQHYHDLHIIAQRLLWRCVDKHVGPADELASVLKENIDRVEDWTAKDTVVLYQSLFTKAHMLPESLANHAGPVLSRNQALFIKTLRELSRNEASERKIKKWMVKLVKTSIENKVALESAETTTGLSIYQYRFIRSLDLTVQELRSACEGQKQLTELRHNLASILGQIHSEEQEVKSQMSLKFI